MDILDKRQSWLSNTENKKLKLEENHKWNGFQMVNHNTCIASCVKYLCGSSTQGKYRREHETPSLGKTAF